MADDHDLVGVAGMYFGAPDLQTRFPLDAESRNESRWTVTIATPRAATDRPAFPLRAARGADRNPT
jgi:hypothetical protein